MLVKLKKKKKKIHFESATRVSDFSDGLQDIPLTVFICKLYLSDSIFFPRIVWTDKLHDLMKVFFSYKGCHGNRKNIFFQLS